MMKMNPANLIKSFAAAAIAGVMALQAGPASATIEEFDATSRHVEDQNTIAAAQSSGRVAILVRSEDPKFREAVQHGVLYLENKFRTETGEDIEIGITYGTDPDGDSSSYEVEILANGLPSDFGFVVNNFSQDEQGIRAVMLDVIQRTWAAHKTHIIPTQTASAETGVNPNPSIN